MCGFGVKSMLLLIFLLVGTPTMAENSYSVFNKSTDTATQFEIQYPLNQTFASRLVAQDSQSTYFKKNAKQNLLVGSENQASLLLLDWHALSGHFRTSLGVLVKHHKMNFSYEPVMVSRTVFSADSEQYNGIGKTVKDKLYDAVTTSSTLQRNQILSDNLSLMQARIQNSSMDTRLEKFIRKYSGELELAIGKENLNAVGTVKFPKTSPYFGIGWGTPLHSKANMRYSIDLGASYQQNPQVDFALHGNVAEAYQRYNESRYNEFLEEKKHAAQKSVGQYQFLPYLSLSWLVRF